MTMTALRLESWRSAPVLREVPVPEPGHEPGHEDAGSVAVVIGIGHLAVQVLEATTAPVVPHEEYRP